MMLQILDLGCRMKLPCAKLAAEVVQRLMLGYDGCHLRNYQPYR